MTISTKSAMTTINIALDQDGHLCDHTIWTPDIAQQLADTLEVNLDAEHLQILQQVRAFFDKFNHAPATRPLIKWLQQTLPEQDISNQKLQQLFCYQVSAHLRLQVIGCNLR